MGVAGRIPRPCRRRSGLGPGAGEPGGCHPEALLGRPALWRFATVADRRVATMSRSRGRVIRVPAPDPSLWEAAVRGWLGLYVSVDVGASRSETFSG